MARVDNRRISAEEIEEVKRLNPVDEVVAGYGIALRPEGRYLKGLCPFHPDANTPNLTIFPDRRKWRCFACGAWGDVVSFVQQKERVTFVEAFQRVRARRPGSAAQPGSRPAAPSPGGPRLAIAPTAAPLDGAPRKQWDRLQLREQMVMNDANTVYQDALWHAPAALAYVRERGLPDWAIRHCGLGYADGHSLELYLRRHGGVQLAERLGLLRRRSGTDPAGAEGQGRSPHRELLAGRITVPELRGGQCIWFIGRVLRTATSRTASSEDDAGRPKYVALPGERPVLGLERAAGRREAFVCEGVFDYLTAVAWRLAACSFCGTHLPGDRLGFLAGAHIIYGLFDADAAGQAAATRAGEQLGPRFRPIALPAGCDLNDLGCRPDGRATFFQLLAAARSESRAASYADGEVLRGRRSCADGPKHNSVNNER